MFHLAWCRTREYQLSTLSPIRILTKDAYAITRVCACAVGRLRGEWGNTQQTSSPPQHYHSTICGNVSWRRCNRSKVRQLILVARSRRSTVRLSLHRGNAQIHRRAVADRPGAAVHQPTICGFQEFRKVSPASRLSLVEHFSFLLLLFWVVDRKKLFTEEVSLRVKSN